jgi:hypothetical protein
VYTINVWVIEASRRGNLPTDVIVKGLGLCDWTDHGISSSARMRCLGIFGFRNQYSDSYGCGGHVVYSAEGCDGRQATLSPWHLHRDITGGWRPAKEHSKVSIFWPCSAVKVNNKMRVPLASVLGTTWLSWTEQAARKFWLNIAVTMESKELLSVSRDMSTMRQPTSESRSTVVLKVYQGKIKFACWVCYRTHKKWWL